MNTAGSLRVRAKASHGGTRDQNRRFVLQQIFSSDPTTRADISRATGLTRATVSDLVSDLIDDGIVAETGTAPSRGGKPPTLLRIDAASRRIITLDVGGPLWTGSDEDLRGKVGRSASVEATGRRGSPAVDALTDLAASLVHKSRGPVLGVGIATPGVVTSDGTVVEAANLDWHGFEVGARLQEEVGVPVHVINDSRAMALAEYAYGRHESENLFVVNLGTGVGAGIILDGRLFHGEGDAAGEIGHVARRDSKGSMITLEQEVGLAAFTASLQSALDTTPETTSAILDQAGEALDNRHDRVSAAVTMAGTRIGALLAGVTGILDIHNVVLAGYDEPIGTALCDAAKAEHDRRVLPAVGRRVSVHHSRVDRAAQRGAARHVIQRELGIV